MKLLTQYLLVGVGFIPWATAFALIAPEGLIPDRVLLALDCDGAARSARHLRRGAGRAVSEE